MRYPTLDKTTAQELLEQLVRDETPSIDARANWAGTGDDLDLRQLDQVLSALQQQVVELSAGRSKVDTEVFEGHVAAAVHQSLAVVPSEILDDRGFWRYLALSRFWWFVSWRERKPIAEGRGLTYVDAVQSVMAIPSRLFLRGQAVMRNGDYSPAYVLPRSTDFWRSHVLRVKVGSAPNLTRAFVRLQAEKGMSTDTVRAYARNLNRTWSNVVLHLYEEDDAYELLTELYETAIEGRADMRPDPV